jgi:hypothetical protein
VLQYAHHNNVEPFLEPVLDLSGAIMAEDAAAVARGSSQGEVLSVFLQQVRPPPSGLPPGLPRRLPGVAALRAAVQAAACACPARGPACSPPRSLFGLQPR